MIVIVFTTGLHVPFPVVVAVKITLPEVTSAAEGMYLAFAVTLFGVNVPVPLLVQETPVATVNVAFNCTKAESPQIV